jgi:hypothetical protein
MMYHMMGKGYEKQGIYPKMVDKRKYKKWSIKGNTVKVHCRLLLNCFCFHLFL